VVAGHLNSNLAGDEANLPQELAFGVLRELAAPGVAHQEIRSAVLPRLRLPITAVFAD
jgi:hypothetical protein